jgi:hypothetical protein
VPALRLEDLLRHVRQEQAMPPIDLAASCPVIHPLPWSLHLHAV